MLTKVQKWEIVKGFDLRKQFFKKPSLRSATNVEVFVQEGRIVIEPRTKVRGRYDLKELVSEMPESYQVEEVDWGSI